MKILTLLIMFGLIAYIICAEDDTDADSGKDKENGTDKKKDKDSSEDKDDEEEDKNDDKDDSEDSKETDKEDSNEDNKDNKDKNNDKDSEKNKDQNKGNSTSTGEADNDKSDKRCAEIKESIFICKTHTMRARCLPINGKWKAVPIGECANNGTQTYCNEEVQGCTTEGSSTTNLNFECGSNGIYPDPSSCQNYYVCSADNGKDKNLVKCNEGSVFSVEKRGCTTNHNLCKIRDIKCKIGALSLYPGSGNTYYMCTESGNQNNSSTNIFMFSCPEDEVFNLNTNKCSSSGSGSTNTDTGNSGMQTQACSSVGLNVDPNDCAKYYRCTNNKRVNFQCPAGTHFSNQSKRCVIGIECSQ